MTCDTPVQHGVKAAKDCQCHGSVMRAYDGLLKAGQPESTALEAAKIVYGYHHPEDSFENRALTVERWVNQESLH